MTANSKWLSLGRINRKTVGIIAACAVLIAAVLITIFAWDLILNLVRDPETFREWASSTGIWAPLIFVGLMALQVIIAVIPGEPLEIAAGYTFGAANGTLLCMAGAFIGSLLVFLFVRCWGRRLVEFFFPQKKIDSLAFLRNEKRLNVLVFILFAIPGTPKDVMTYFMGLTKMKLHVWLLISTVARIPSIITSTMGGDALGIQNYTTAIIIFAITLVCSAAGILVYKQISRMRRRRHGERK